MITNLNKLTDGSSITVVYILYFLVFSLRDLNAWLVDGLMVVMTVP